MSTLNLQKSWTEESRFQRFPLSKTESSKACSHFRSQVGKSHPSLITLNQLMPASMEELDLKLKMWSRTKIQYTFLTLSTSKVHRVQSILKTTMIRLTKSSWLKDQSCRSLQIGRRKAINPQDSHLMPNLSNSQTLKTISRCPSFKAATIPNARRST